MNKYFILFLFILILVVTGVSFYQVTADQVEEAELVDPKLGNSDLRFIENKGQWDARIKYLVRLNGGNFFLESNRFTYSLYEMPEYGHGHGQGNAFGVKEDENEKRIKGHNFRVEFQGSNPESVIQPGLTYPEYHNYFIGNDPARWAGKVPLHGLLTYENLYPGTDLRIYGLGDAVKYDLILEPGVDPDIIKLKYSGIDKISIKKGSLHIKTAVRELIELPPVVYQIIGERKKLIACKYKLDKNVLSFEFPDGYDPNYGLVIDPTLVFSTYTGSFSDNWGFTATYDTAGNAYAGGIQWGMSIGSGYPTTIGAFDNTFNGGQTDITISKLNPNGTGLLYSTFLGGNNEDRPHSLVANDDQELVVFGRTNSGNFPTTFGAVDRSLNGGFDIFVTRFTNDGSGIIGSTFLGGSADDGVNGNSAFNIYTATKYNYGDDSRGEVILDAQDNIYVAAPTRSSNFPIVGAVFQPSNQGQQDGVIIRLNPDLSNIDWSSYFGGSGEDAIHTLKLDNANNLYIAGGTNSSNLPTTPGAVFGTFRSGRADGFVAKVSGNGSAILNCTYIGTSDYDQVYLLEIDDDNDIYVSGQSNGNFPIVDAPFGPVFRNQNANQFIAKLNGNLTNFIYSTTFGSPNASFPNISPTAFLVDRCENVYVTGWGGATNTATSSPNLGDTNGMPTSGDAFQRSTDGSDFYLIVLDRDVQNLLYGSYFGGVSSNGDHVDGGTSRFDKNGVVYHAVCASCGGTNAFPATPGNVVSTTNNSPNCNLALFKVAFDLAGIEAAFIPLDSNNVPILNTEGCAPLSVNFDNRSVRATTGGTPMFTWDFDDNGATSNQFEPTHIFQDPGTYEVMLIITDSSSCNIADTTYEMITVFPPPVVDIGPDQDVCAGDTILLQSLTPGVGYLWEPSSNFITPDSLATAMAVVTTTIDYVLTLTDANGCSASDAVRINVDDSFQVNGRNDTLICRGGSAPLRAVSNGGVSYAWTSNPPVTISDPFISNPIASNIDTTTVFYVRSENNLGCKSIDSVRIEVFEVFTLEDTFVCDGSSIQLLSNNGASFVWTPDDGTLDNPNSPSPIASPLVTTTYTVTATSAEGCISVKDVLVEVRPNPVADAGTDTEICFGFDTQLSATGAINFLWTPATGLFDPTISDPMASPEITTIYTVTVTDESGCTDTDEVTVVVNPLPIVDAGEDQIICEAESFQLSATGATVYEWSPGTGLNNPNIANPVASPTTSTMYQVTGTDNNGCQNVDDILIEVIPRPTTFITGVNNTCLGGEIELTANGGQEYLWNTGDTTATIFVNPTTPTTYIATAFIGSCAGVPDSITVDSFFGFPEASFTAAPVQGYAPFRVDFTNTSTGASSYLWIFGNGLSSTEENPSTIYPSAGEFEATLIALSSTNCPDTFTLTVLLDNVTLHVPSGFTPNGDDVNDAFYIGYQGIRNLNVKIFSRWGPLIYESDNPDFRWDGRYKDEPVPEGVYVYVITGTGENNLFYERVGTVTLVR